MAARITSPSTRPQPRITAIILGSALLMFAILDGGLRILTPHLDDQLSRLLLTALMLGVALAVERLVFKRGLRFALRALGYGRPTRRSLVVGALLTALVLAYFPAVALLGVEISLRRDWLWVLAGAVALNGFAEETLFRGFVFGHLRAQGRTFRNAMAVSLVVFAAAHLLLLLDNHPAVVGMAILVAITTAFAYAYLYERGGNTIWALVILHVSTHAVRLFDNADSMPVLIGWIALQVAAPFLVFLFRRYLEGAPRPRLNTGQTPTSRQTA